MMPPSMICRTFWYWPSIVKGKKWDLAGIQRPCPERQCLPEAVIAEPTFLAISHACSVVVTGTAAFNSKIGEAAVCSRQNALRR
jgi:hypothetical protein